MENYVLNEQELAACDVGRAVWAMLWKLSSKKQRAKLQREEDWYSNVRRWKREAELMRREVKKLDPNETERY
jgi:hypothetical protein